MRVVSLIVVALALASVSNQSFLSFGEFVEGHDAVATSGKVFEIIGGAEQRFQSLINGRRTKPTVVVQDQNTISLHGLCNTCTSSHGKSPVCTRINCDYDTNYLQAYASAIIFHQRSASAYFWSKSFGTFHLAGAKPAGCPTCRTPYITFRRIK